MADSNVEDDVDERLSDSEIKSMLELQLSEVEMLQSMFPEEFTLDDPNVLSDIQLFLGNELEREDLHSRIGFTLKLNTGSSESSKDLEVVCHLPHEYPKAHPEIFTRTKHLNRVQQKVFLEGLHTFIDGTDHGDICVYPIIHWIQENYETYISTESESEHATRQNKETTTFTRLWIYSHHIYSKTKRTDINAWGQELKLSGFIMPGKPGVICAEGESEDVDDFWFRIRRMNWKRIMIKEKLDSEIQIKNIDQCRKFGVFQEIAFDVRGGKAREYHMDLGLFNKFLQDHDCAEIFEIYFGVQGKSL